LPIVVTRDERNDYIDALEAADDGDLEPLVKFTARLQRRAVLQATLPSATQGRSLTPCALIHRMAANTPCTRVPTHGE